MTRSRDVDFYLLERLNDKQLFQVMLLNKKFLKLATDFFEKRLKERYPLLLKFKPKSMNFTKYYLSQVYYISKLKEEYDLEYIPAPSLNPRIYYYELKNDDSEMTQNYYYYYIGEMGNLSLVKRYENNEAALITNLFRGSIVSGNIELVRYMAENYPVDNLSYMYHAVLSKNSEIIGYIWDKLFDFFPEEELNEEAVYAAAELGDLELVKHYEKWLPPNIDFHQILSRIPNVTVFKYFLEKMKNMERNEEIDPEQIDADIKETIYYSILHNRLNILEYIILEMPEYIENIREFNEEFGNGDVSELLDNL